MCRPRHYSDCAPKTGAMTATRDASPHNPRELLETQLHLIEEVIQFTRRRNRFSPEIGEEFASYAHLKLIENDCAILAKFQGRSSLKTYLTTVIQRLALDYQAKAWGKWRPSTAARNLGPEAIRLEMLTHRDGLPLRAAIETMVTGGETKLGPEELHALVARLPVRHRRRFESEDALDCVPADGVERPDTALLDREREKSRAQAEAALNGALSALAREERVILKMRFRDGLQVRQIAEALGVPAKGLYRRIERLVVGLRTHMERAGVHADDLSDVVGHPGRDIALEL